MFNNFKDLKIWNKGINLVVDIYKLTSKFPIEEKYGLISQIRRSAVSIPSNIAEGHSRKTSKDFKQFIAIAKGSLSELETQLIISFKLSFISREEFEIINDKIKELEKMTASFYGKL
ncbi:MAG: four helix bundle protein [Patescibacteria group bacterium]